MKRNIPRPEGTGKLMAKGQNGSITLRTIIGSIVPRPESTGKLMGCGQKRAGEIVISKYFSIHTKKPFQLF
ncbi:MAG: hypothetical protein GXO89_08105 [Chlorobi bacterium]|nr:hypothetical protein [Chlorobiota bacterium]